MSHSLDIRYGKLIRGLRLRIRSRICRNALATRWHLGHARDMLKDLELHQARVTFEDEEDEHALRAKYPALLEKIRRSDQACAKAWLRDPDSFAFTSARRELEHLFRQLRFDLKMYEKLADQPRKPHLEQTRELLDSPVRRKADVRAFEKTFRLSLQEYVELEVQTEADLARIRLNREKYVNHYFEFAHRIATKQKKTSAYFLDAARKGLQKAAYTYDYQRGYKFTLYAAWWVKRAIEIAEERQANPDAAPPATWAPDS